MENIDLSNVHILALFRQYYAITLAQFRYNHVLSDNHLEASLEESANVNEQCTSAATFFRTEINKRLNININDDGCREKFMAWYEANEKFIYSLTNEEYEKFETIETAYINSDFADPTEFKSILSELKYDEYIKEQLANSDLLV